jgi:hypothetical protein
MARTQSLSHTCVAKHAFEKHRPKNRVYQEGAGTHAAPGTPVTRVALDWGFHQQAFVPHNSAIQSIAGNLTDEFGA